MQQSRMTQTTDDDITQDPLGASSSSVNAQGKEPGVMRRILPW